VTKTESNYNKEHKSEAASVTGHWIQQQLKRERENFNYIFDLYFTFDNNNLRNGRGFLIAHGKARCIRWLVMLKNM